MSTSPTTQSPGSRPTLASFWRDLPRDGKFLLSTVIIDFVGNGLVLPFGVVYLHEVRQFELAQVGVLLAIPAIVGLLVVGPVGALIDRVGARLVVIVSLVGQAVGMSLLATATTQVHAATALVVQGAASGVAWPAITTLIAVIVPSRLRQRYFGVNFTLLNLGIGLGGIIGGVVLDVARPETFVAVYLADAATYLAPLVILLGPLRHVSGRAAAPPPVPSGPSPPPSGLGAAAASPTAVTYRALLRDRSLLVVLVIGFVSTFVGYGQLNTGVPAFGRAEAGISTRVLGLAFTANTVVIVVLQLFVLQRIEGRRRTRLLVVMGLIWAAAFAALGAAGLASGGGASGGTAASVLFVTCLAVFGLGETLFQPTIPAMVNDLAPDHLRGRYNAASSLAWQSAAIVGPIAAGALIGRGWGAAYIAMLVGGCLGVAGLALRAERSLSAHVNGRSASFRSEVLAA